MPVFGSLPNLEVLMSALFIVGFFFNCARCVTEGLLVGLKLSLGRPGGRNQLAVLVQRSVTL